jgi:hypothetical protein
MERPNKAKVGAMAQWKTSIANFRAAMGARLIWYPHLSPLQGEPFILLVPRVKTLG